MAFKEQHSVVINAIILTINWSISLADGLRSSMKENRKNLFTQFQIIAPMAWHFVAYSTFVDDDYIYMWLHGCFVRMRAPLRNTT